MFPPPTQNTVAICNQIALLILSYISTSLVTLLKVICPYTYLYCFSSSSNLAFSYTCFLFLKCTVASHRTLFMLFTLLWLVSCTHFILAYFLWSKNPKRFSSNHALCCFSSCKPRLSPVEVLILSLMFPKPCLYPLHQFSSPKPQTCL